MSDPDTAKRQKIINKMSNWQRTQWAKNGYSKDFKILEKFLALERSLSPETENGTV